MNPSPNLFLIGPMGAGKTTIGSQIAEAYRMPFVDLDHEIEARTGATVSLIFDLEGEAGFRRRESAVLDELTQRRGFVLATGGGAVLDANNRRVLRERGFVIWLDTPIDVQIARLERDRQRPLLRAPDRHARLQQLAVERDPLYAQIADLRLPSTDVGTGAQVERDLLDLLQARWHRDSAGVIA
ncbi:MAG: shikimate kinase [Rhodanobacter sp.]|nr:shikimate kinase [Rhodanobacter sp.]